MDVGTCVSYSEVAKDVVIDNTIMFLRIVGLFIVVTGGYFVGCLFYFVFRPPTTLMHVRSVRGMCIVMMLAIGLLFFIQTSDLCTNTGLDTKCRLGSGGVIAIGSIIMWQATFITSCFWMVPISSPTVEKQSSSTRRASLSHYHRGTKKSSLQRNLRSSERRVTGDIDSVLSNDTIPELEQAININTKLSIADSSCDDSQQTFQSETDDDAFYENDHQTREILQSQDGEDMLKKNELRTKKQLPQKEICIAADAVFEDEIVDISIKDHETSTEGDSHGRLEEIENPFPRQSSFVIKEKPVLKLRNMTLVEESMTQESTDIRATTIHLESSSSDEMLDIRVARNSSLQWSLEGNSIINSSFEDGIVRINSQDSTNSISTPPKAIAVVGRTEIDFSRCESF